MFVPRSTSMQCVFIPLAVCTLVMLCGGSPSVQLRTKQHQPAIAGQRKTGLNAQENCSSSTPSFPPSFSHPLCLYYPRYAMFLQITSEGVGGSVNKTRLEMEMVSVGACLVRIKSTANGRYLAMKNGTSELYTQVKPDLYAVFRLQDSKHGFRMLQSYQHSDWYVGLRRNDKPKKGKKVRPSTGKGDGAFLFFECSPHTKTLKPLSRL